MSLLQRAFEIIGLRNGGGPHRGHALRVFLLDDDERRHEWFMKRFSRDDLDIAKDVPEATALLSRKPYDAIFLDHDLLPEHYEADAPADDERTGYAVAVWLSTRRDLQQESRIVVHTRNADGAMRMVEELRRSGRQADYVPFTVLSQRITSVWKR
ncbi:MAG TPA: cyclic-phosphate processing receiver domain-containing protein [Pyrinomonadaceae bacterium]|nr:cyclic-phosphate processing receiver domain-containing protein [Pyrinomonadaceae bacterium]